MRLCRVDEERVAEINSSSFPGGQQFFAVGSRREAISGQFAKRETAFSGRK
jgi:hypothetical protein